MPQSFCDSHLKWFNERHSSTDEVMSPDGIDGAGQPYILRFQSHGADFRWSAVNLSFPLSRIRPPYQPCDARHCPGRSVPYQILSSLSIHRIECQFNCRYLCLLQPGCISLNVHVLIFDLNVRSCGCYVTRLLQAEVTRYQDSSIDS